MNNEHTEYANEAAKAMAKAFRKSADEHRRRAAYLDKEAERLETFAGDGFNPPDTETNWLEEALRSRKDQLVEGLPADPVLPPVQPWGNQTPTDNGNG